MKNIESDFNRFLDAVTRRKLPDRVPNAELEVDVEIMEEFMGYSIRNVEDNANFWRNAGYDYTVLYIRGQPIPAHLYQEIVGERTPDQENGASSCSTYDSAGIIDNKSFDQYPWVDSTEVYYRDVDMIKDFLPDGMKLIISQGPLFCGIWRIMGFDNFALACVENLELIKAIADKLGKLCITIIENVLQRDWVGAIWFGDDLAYTNDLMVSPEIIRSTVFPYYKKIGDLCKEYRKPFIFHSDGNIAKLYTDLIECGVQAIHPNEPTSVNIVDLKKKYGDRLSFIGNIDVGLLSLGTVDEVREATKSLISNVAPAGGLALGSGNSVTKYMPMANYRAMLDTVRDYGAIY